MAPSRYLSYQCGLAASGHTRQMPDSEDRPPTTQSSCDYGDCPRCGFIVPLVPDCTTGDPQLGIPPVYSGALRCGLCARELVPRGQWPLDFRHDCTECGAAMCAPAKAAVVVCPLCDAYYFNPSNPPDVRQRVDEVLAERARLAELVAQLDKRLAEAAASTEPDPYRTLNDWLKQYGPTFEADQSGFRRPEKLPSPLRIPEEWINRLLPLHEVFVDTFTQAIRLNGLPRERRVVALRYGLDGQPGRTFREIGAELGHSSSRAREFLHDVLYRICDVVRHAQPDPAWDASRRACALVVHIAIKVLGDPNDEQTPARIRIFVNEAFPTVHPRASAYLITTLADYALEVFRKGDQDALGRAVAAVRLPDGWD
jgi:Sigma-70, region 4